ncbi:MAG: DUF1573 domain-containing protein, partial [Draconibacterium sp.]
KNRFIIVFFIELIVGCIFASCSGTKRQESIPDNDGTPIMAFTKKLHNFGKVKAGQQISFSFKFENSGDADLRIDSLNIDCGCLDVIYPREAIKEGTSNFVDVVFDSSGEVGRVLKQIIVYSNGSVEPITLSIVSEVNNPMFNF